MKFGTITLFLNVIMFIMEINPTEFTPYLSLSGGMLIGISSFLLYILIGKIAGISGILTRASQKIISWEMLFIIGVIIGGLIPPIFLGTANIRVNYPISLAVISGILVGVGTFLANGCTSGHGVCGISRMSARSIVATISFMLSAIITVYFLRS